MRAWKGEAPFRELLASDTDVTSRIPKDKLAALFDLDHALAHVPAILERTLGISHPSSAISRQPED
jgi:adenylosuccinate lyase